jgi:HTH-type transcriptional regulator, sugar sensing transcriptional regulator
MLKETLCQIGFTHNEAKIFIALVELGPQPANIISRKTGLKRTTVYPIIKNLEKKSLISSFLKDGVAFFSVNNLKNLLEYVGRKRRLLDHHRDFVLDILPRMELLRGKSFMQPRVHFFEGKAGVENVMNDSLDSSGPIYCITSIEKWLNSDLQDFVQNYTDIRLFDKKIPLQGIAQDTEEARRFLNLDNPFTSFRFVDDADDLFDNITNIYDNKVAIVCPERDYEFGVLIESEEFAKTQKSIFKLAWKGALVQNGESKNKDRKRKRKA